MKSTSGRRPGPVQRQPELFNESGDKAPPILPKLPWVPLEVPRDVEAGLRLMDEPSPTTLVSTHITARGSDGPETQGNHDLTRCTLKKYKQDALVIGSKSHGRPPTARGKRKAIKGKRPTAKSLANLAFRLGNCEPEITSMITLTMTPFVHWRFPVAIHRKALHAFLQWLRRMGIDRYVWVREFTVCGTVHWHIFIAVEVKSTYCWNDKDGREHWIDYDLSRQVSQWFTAYYAKKSECPRCVKGHYADCEKAGQECGESFRKMAFPMTADHVGCAHVEALEKRGAAAMYAAKEGAKRFQKEAPDKRWHTGGGAWWNVSSGFEFPEYGTEDVLTSDLALAKFVTPEGFEVETPYRIQHGKGALSQHGTKGKQ